MQFYLGIDPGRDKTGVALVEETGRILAVQVMRTRNFSDALLQFLYDRLQVSNTWGLRKILKAVVLGNGTGSEEHNFCRRRKILYGRSKSPVLETVSSPWTASPDSSGASDTAGTFGRLRRGGAGTPFYGTGRNRIKP